MNFVIEGPIGAGKTTLLTNTKKVLIENYDIAAVIYPEPMQEWKETPAGDLLSLFGDDKKAFAFITQVYKKKHCHLPYKSKLSSSHIFNYCW